MKKLSAYLEAMSDQDSVISDCHDPQLEQQQEKEIIKSYSFTSKQKENKQSFGPDYFLRSNSNRQGNLNKQHSKITNRVIPTNDQESMFNLSPLTNIRHQATATFNLALLGSKSPRREPSLNKQPVSSTPKTSPKVDSPKQNDKPDTQKQECKRRGRKRIADSQYFDRAEKKIQSMKDKLKNEKDLDIKIKRALRNKISAQNARIRKKKESIFLLQVVDEKDSKMRALIQAVGDIASPRTLQKIQSQIATQWGIDVPQQKKQKVNSRSVSPKATPNIPYSSRGDFKKLLIENFETKEEELELFKQNDEKEIDIEDLE